MSLDSRTSCRMRYLLQAELETANPELTHTETPSVQTTVERPVGHERRFKQMPVARHAA